MHGAGLSKYHYQGLEHLRRISGKPTTAARIDVNDTWALLGYNGGIPNLFWRDSKVHRWKDVPATVENIVPKLIGNVSLPVNPDKNSTYEILHVKLKRVKCSTCKPTQTTCESLANQICKIVKPNNMWN